MAYVGLCWLMRIVGFSSYSLAANQPMKSITEADKKQLTPEEAHLQFLSQRGKAMDRPALLWRELPFFRHIRTVYGIHGDSSWDTMGDMSPTWYDIWVWYQTMLGRPLFRV